MNLAKNDQMIREGWGSVALYINLAGSQLQTFPRKVQENQAPNKVSYSKYHHTLEYNAMVGLDQSSSSGLVRLRN